MRLDPIVAQELAEAAQRVMKHGTPAQEWRDLLKALASARVDDEKNRKMMAEIFTGMTRANIALNGAGVSIKLPHAPGGYGT